MVVVGVPPLSGFLRHSGMKASARAAGAGGAVIGCGKARDELAYHVLIKWSLPAVITKDSPDGSFAHFVHQMASE